MLPDRQREDLVACQRGEYPTILRNSGGLFEMEDVLGGMSEPE